MFVDIPSPFAERRGLKFIREVEYDGETPVAVRRTAWIEIRAYALIPRGVRVAVRRTAWIEISNASLIPACIVSPFAERRGLKSYQR